MEIAADSPNMLSQQHGRTTPLTATRKYILQKYWFDIKQKIDVTSSSLLDHLFGRYVIKDILKQKIGLSGILFHILRQ